MKTKTFFKMAAGAALILGFAFPALAQHAQVPVLSSNFVKPNVMILLDSSGSMDWNLSGGGANATNPSRISIAQMVLNGGVQVALQYLAQNVYQGQTGGAHNYKVKSSGTNSMYIFAANIKPFTPFPSIGTTTMINITTPFTKIMRLKSCTSGCTYQPAAPTDPLAIYFVFVDNDDLMFASVGGSNAPGYVSTSNPGYMTTGTGNAFTTLDLFLLQQNKFGLNIVNHTDIRDGGTTTSQLVKFRDVYQAVTITPPTTPPVYPRDVFIKYFSDVYNIPNNPGCTISYAVAPPTVSCTAAASNFEVQPTGSSPTCTTACGIPLNPAITVTRTSRVFPVVYVPNTATSGCYKSGTKWVACYKPIAAGSQVSGSYYFVFMDGTDYKVAMNNANNTSWPVSLPLRDYLHSKGRLSYKWYSYYPTGTGTAVCGDSTGTCSSNDGRSGNRVLFEAVPDGTAGATLFRDTDPTDDEVRTAMVGNIPEVQLTDVVKPDGIYGPDFIFMSPFNARLDYAARMGLWIPQPPTQDILDTLNRGLTYTKDGGANYYHFLDGKYTLKSGVLAFDGLTYDYVYYQANPGLLDIYTNIRWGLAKYDNSGTGSGTCPGANTDFPGCGADLLVSLPDEYTQGLTDADTVRRLVKKNIANFPTDGYTPIADSLRNMYQYFFAPALKANLPTGRNDTDPTMYVDQDCNAATGAPPTGCKNEGHVLQDEKAYTTTVVDGHGCRKNFLVFVTDGVQSMGLGCTGTTDPSNPCPTSGNKCCPADVIPYDRQWVDSLKSGMLTGGAGQGDPYKGVKVFVIGFALANNAEGAAAKLELEAIALRSKMDKDPTDVYTIPYYANSEAELKLAFSQIFNVIMEGSYTRSSPKTDAQETVEADGYFTVEPDEPMWRGHLELYDLTKALTPEDLDTLMPMADGASVLNQTLFTNRDIFTAEPASGGTVWAFYHGSKVGWDKVNFIATNWATLLSDLAPGEQNGDTAENKEADAEALISFISATAKNSPKAHFKPDTYPGSTLPKPGPNRTWTLGAINRSVPLLVGPPAGVPATNFRNYKDFLKAHEARPVLIYIGANDGMLHAFYKNDPDDPDFPTIPATHPRVILEEAFAYIPHAVLSTLKYLRSNQWYYVDASPVAADIFIPQPSWVNLSAGDTAALQKVGCADVGGGEVYCWRTLLVSGLGPGGREYFALDITDADTVSAANTSTPTAPQIHTLWEFSDKIWADTPPTELLGDSWSLPFLAELRQGDGDSTSVAAIFGGGWSASNEYNVGNYIYFVTVDDASILRRYYIPDKDDPSWKTKMDKGLSLDTLAGSTVAAPFPNAQNNLPGDASVVDVPDQEGLSELLYIGDLQGRMWKVNMASGDTSEWKACLFYDTGDTIGIGDSRSSEGKANDKLPLPPNPPTVLPSSTYTAFDALRRPIFYGPTVVPAPQGGRLVIFGTGHIEEASVARNESVVNCIFAVWDKDPIDSNTVEDICNYGTLWNQAQKDASQCPQCVSQIYYPFCFEPGEKLISKPSVSEGLLSFQTFKPFSADHCAADYNPCEPGVIRDWFVDYLTFYGILHLSTPGSEGRYIQQSEFTASGLTLTQKFGYIYTIPGKGVHGFTPPTGKSSDVLSWGEGMSFTW